MKLECHFNGHNTSVKYPQVRIQDLVGGGAASEAKSCRLSGVESHE